MTSIIWALRVFLPPLTHRSLSVERLHRVIVVVELLCACTCTSLCVVLFCFVLVFWFSIYFLLLFVLGFFLFGFLEGEKKLMKFGWEEGGKDLGGTEGQETCSKRIV